MFASRLTQSAASQRVFGGAMGTAIVAASLVTAATPASAADGTATVTLTVDGVSNSVTTAATTVSDLLTQQAVSYDSSDLVNPGYQATLFDGMAVSWTPAKRVYVRANGTRTAHRVVGDTVRQVTAELNLPVGAAKSTRREAYSYEDARVYGPLGAQLSADETVRENSVAIVHKIRFAFPDRYLRINHKVVKDRSKLVRSGGSRVFKEGHDGRKHVVYRNRYLDGKLTSQRIAQSKVVSQPQRRVVRVGTGPNWVGLAACESGGNPNAVNPAGFYGLYQFSISTWHAVGGKGIPTDYGYWEQTKRAWKLYKGSGRSPWPVCGSRL
ncbi:MAG: transglycosylase family protein [Actinomycetia bacterium]|nr:transglycosylase family protein [Actinomycetes bacterium]